VSQLQPFDIPAPILAEFDSTDMQISAAGWHGQLGAASEPAMPGHGKRCKGADCFCTVCGFCTALLASHEYPLGLSFARDLPLPDLGGGVGIQVAGSDRPPRQG
jgi:hypothetical protein